MSLFAVGVKQCDLDVVVPTKEIDFFQRSPVALRSPEGLMALWAGWIAIDLGSNSFVHRWIRPDCFAFVAEDDRD